MKKIITVLLAIMCMFTLCACGGGGGDTPAGDNGDGTITIKIGGSGPLTGDAAAYGLAVRNAAQIAVDEVNASDSKIKFDFKMEDDEASGEKAVTAYGILYDWGMQVSLFTVTSGSGAAVAANYDEDKIFAITPSGSSTDLVYTGSKNYAGNFQMCFTDPNQGIVSVQYIKGKFASSKIGVIYKNDDVYSAGVYDKFKAEAETEKLDVVYVGTFDDSNATDFNTQLAACQAAGADLVYLPIYYQPASLVLAQAKAMDYAPVFFGIDGMDGILTLDGFDTALAEGVYQLTPFDASSSDANVKHFVDAYEAKYGETPNQFAADAYDCIYAIKKALENIGLDNIDPDNLYEPMIAQFTSMSFDGITGSGMTWAANGEVNKLPKAVIIANGVYVSAD